MDQHAAAVARCQTTSLHPRTQKCLLQFITSFYRLAVCVYGNAGTSFSALAFSMSCRRFSIASTSLLLAACTTFSQGRRTVLIIKARD